MNGHATAKRVCEATKGSLITSSQRPAPVANKDAAHSPVPKGRSKLGGGLHAAEASKGPKRPTDNTLLHVGSPE